MKNTIKDFKLLKIENLQSIKGGSKAAGLVDNPLHKVNSGAGNAGDAFEGLG